MELDSVLVTGANGFVGQHLLGRLVSSNRRIVALHHRPLAPALRAQFGDAVNRHQAGIATDSLSCFVEGIGTVFHLAAYATPSEAPAAVAEMVRVNCLGTQRLGIASKLAAVRRFIFVSSSAAGEYSLSCDIDESNGHPGSSYGKSKRDAEDALLPLGDDAFGITVLRPSALFGEHHLGSVYELVKVIQQGRFVMIGDGQNRTNFYYIADFVDVLLAVENHAGACGQVFVASDEPCSLEELVVSIQTALGLDSRVRRIPRWLGYTLGYCFDAISSTTVRPLPLSVRRVRAMTRDVAYRNHRLRRELGLRVNHGLPEGLRRSIDWYRQEGLL